MGDSFVYLVKGFDNQGYFEIRRRYKDFDLLRETFHKRMPGLYIPSLPPKTLFSKSDHQFLEERSFHLEQFMKKVYKLFYLQQSDEFAIFARYKKPAEQPAAPDFAKKLETMPTQNAAMLAFRIKCAVQSNEVGHIQVNLTFFVRNNSIHAIWRECKMRLSLLRASAKNMLSILKHFKNCLKSS